MVGSLFMSLISGSMLLPSNYAISLPFTPRPAERLSTEGMRAWAAPGGTSDLARMRRGSGLLPVHGLGPACGVPDQLNHMSAATGFS